jgi:hypothetical protein
MKVEYLIDSPNERPNVTAIDVRFIALHLPEFMQFSTISGNNILTARYHRFSDSRERVRAEKRLIPFFIIPEIDLDFWLPFSQVWEKGLGDEGKI